MTTTLISGANKGLGLETARQLIALGHTVLLGSRDPDRGARAAEEVGAVHVPLDVTDDASVAAAAKRAGELGGIDVLINNAGIEPRTPDGGFVDAGDLTGPDALHTFDTNAIGIVRMMHAFLPQLTRSTAPVVVNLTSGLASIGLLSDPDSPAHFYPGIDYPASKAAVSMITVQYAKALPGIRINAVEPGFTKTDLNHRQGTQTVEEGARIIVRMATIGPDGPTGTRVSMQGPLPL